VGTARTARRRGGRPLSEEGQHKAGAGTLNVDLGGDALSGFPGPALVVGADGTVDAANPAGASLSRALGGVLPDGLTDLIHQAIASGIVRQRALQFGETDPPVFLDATAISITGSDAALVLLRDLSLEGRLRATLVESRQRYKDLVEISSDFAWETGADGTFVFVSPRGALGWAAEQLVGKLATEFLSGPLPGDGNPFTTARRQEEAEIQFRRADGSVAILKASSGPVFGAEEAWAGARGVCRDITVEREQERALARAQRREALINRILRAMREEIDPVNMLQVAATAIAETLSAAGVLILRARADGFEVGASHAGDSRIEQVVALAGGLQSEPPGALRHSVEGDIDLLGQLSDYGGKVNGAVAIWRAADGAGWPEQTDLLISEVAGQLGIAIEQIAAHESIVNLSRTDGLTGLLNRRAFFGDVERHVRRLQRDGDSAALIYVDLDNFKMVNDVHGHERGDEALLGVRDLLQAHTRPGDLIARLGGDEFALWLSNTDEETSAARAIRLLDESQTLQSYSGAPDKPLGMSLGIAVYEPAAGEELKGLLARADAAMYEVKHSGKGSYRIAPPAGPASGSA
jgi:diguanylate cyclase (GGDEF)-like protein/PAS domain S-box-containing protein